MEIRVERRPETDRLREARALLRGMAVEALLVDDHGDAEARLLDEEPLDGVGQVRHRARAQAAARVAGPADLPESAAVAEMLPGLLRVEPALVVDEHRRLLLPDAEHLGDLLLERHPREQVGGPFVGALRRIPVRQGRRCGAHRVTSTGW